MNRIIRIRIRRWYIVLAVRLPGASQPACVGLGLDGYENAARSEATRLAEAMQ